MELSLHRFITGLLLPLAIPLAACAPPNAVRQTTWTDDPPPAIAVEAVKSPLNKPSDALAVEFGNWLSRARDGDANAQFHVGTLYDRGEGAAKNPQQALDWFHAAAAQGHVEAQFCLALMYLKGRGTAKDDTLAAHWFEKAAEQGHATAQYRLGMAYATGTGVARHHESSYFWLRKAAEQDNTSAQHYLGLRYAKGDGVEKDPQKAAEWIYRAGLGFIAHGRIEAARVTLRDIEQETPGHALVTQLRTRLSLSETPPAARRPNLDLAGASVGTGWPIAEGYVVTNNHVVANSNELVLINTNGETIDATVVERDEEHDLAVLSVADTQWLPLALPLARQRAYADASVFTVGFPRIDLLGETPKVSAGRVSDLNGLENDPSSYQLNLTIQQGNSGGPLVNTNGEVVGIVASMLGAVDAYGNVHVLPDVSYAVKVGHLRDMLAFLPIRYPGLDELPHYTDTIDELADRIQHSVLIVVAR